MPNWCYNQVKLSDETLAKRIKTLIGQDENVFNMFQALLDLDVEQDFHDLGSNDALFQVNPAHERLQGLELCYQSRWSPHLYGWALVSAKYNVDIEVRYCEDGMDFSGIAKCTPEKLYAWSGVAALDYLDLDHPDDIKRYTVEDIKKEIGEYLESILEDEDDDEAKEACIQDMLKGYSYFEMSREEILKVAVKSREMLNASLKEHSARVAQSKDNNTSSKENEEQS